MSNLISPKVTVLTLVFNQERFVGQCLENIVNQKTLFNFDLVVHEDCSTDQSASIIQVLAARYPDKIKPFYAPENRYKKIGFSGIFSFLLDQCNGDYIAFCEGDDYWIDPLKLQKQVDYLEAHPECGMVYTQADVYVQETGTFHKGWARQNDFRGLLTGLNTICTPTVMIRKSLFERYYEEVDSNPQWLMGDFPIWLYIAHCSKIHFMEDVTTVYRQLPNSASHSKKLDDLIRFVECDRDVRNYFSRKYCPECEEAVNSYYVNWLFKLMIEYQVNLSSYIRKQLIKYRMFSPWLWGKCLYYLIVH